MQRQLSLRRATDLNRTFVTLFTELSVKLSEDDRKRIQDVIDAVSLCLSYHDNLLILILLHTGGKRYDIPTAGAICQITWQTSPKILCER